MTKIRSPNYPYLDFAEAVEKIRMLYSKEQRHTCSREVIATSIGYSGISGTSGKAIAALNSYELLEGRNENYVVSTAAIAILFAEKNDPERIQAIKHCALAPKLFAELNEKFGHEPHRLPSDENFKYYLVKNGYTTDAISLIIKRYKNTIEYIYNNAAPEDSKTAEYRIDENEGVNFTEEKKERPTQSLNSTSKSDDYVETLKFRISSESHAVLNFTGPVTRQAIEKLARLLEITKDDYPDADLDPLN
jgi:hypothetical protein